MKRLKFTKKQAKKFLKQPLLTKKVVKLPKRKGGFSPVFTKAERTSHIKWKGMFYALLPLWLFYAIAYFLWETDQILEFWQEVLLRLSRTAPAYTLPFIIALIADYGLRLLIDKGKKTIQTDIWEKRYKYIWVAALIISAVLLPGGLWHLYFMPYGFFIGIFGIVLFLVQFILAMNVSWRESILLQAENLPSNPVKTSKDIPYNGSSIEPS